MPHASSLSLIVRRLGLGLVRLVVALVVGLGAAPAFPLGTALDPWAPPPPGGRSAVLEGRVLSGGRPLAGAVASLHPAGRPAAPPATRASSDGDGYFTLPAPAPALWRLRLEADGLPPREIPLLAGLGDLVLPPAELQEPAVEPWVAAAAIGAPAEAGQPSPTLALAGRVTDAVSAAPLQGALVWPAGRPEGVVTTDRRGSFQLLLPAGTASGVVDVAAPGYRFRRYFLPHGPRGTEALEAALEPAAEASGLVLGGGGRPLPQARLEARPAGLSPEARREPPGPYPMDGHPSAYTDRGGRFRLQGLASGRSHLLVAAARGRLPARAVVPALEPFAAAAGYNFILAPSSPAEGRVVDAAGRPVAGARVRVSPVQAELADALGSAGFEAMLGWRAQTGPGGRFALAGLPPSPIVLLVEGPGFLPARVPGIEVPPPVSGTVDLGTVALTEAEVLAGTVEDPRGRPLAEAEVAVRGAAVPRDVSDLRGEFRLSPLTPGEAIDLEVRAQGFAPAVLAGVAVPPERPLRVVLQPQATLSGRVIDSQGKAPEGLRLFLLASGPEGGPEAPPEVLMALATDEAGRFSAPVSPGRVRLTAWAAAARPVTSEEIPVEAGEAVEGVELELAAGAVVSGTVVSARGEAVAGAALDARPLPAQGEGGEPPWGTVRSTLSAEDGSFRLAGLEAGATALEVRLRGFLRAVLRLELEEGGEELEIELSPAFEAVGRVLDAEEQPVGGARVRLQGARGGETAEVFTDAQGGFRFSQVPAGEYRIAAEHEGHGPAALEVLPIPARSRREVVLRLGSEAVLSGELRGLDPDQLGRAEVTARGPGGAHRRGGASWQGRYTVDGLGPGSWSVEASVPGGEGRASALLELEPGRRRTVLDLDFGSGVRLSGRVRLGGEPWAGASLRIHRLGGGGQRRAVADRGGEFRWSGLEPGHHRLEVADPQGELVHAEDLELLEDREISLDLAAATVRGQVLERPGGGPVPGAELRLLRLDGPPGAVPATRRRADLQGAFTFPRVSFGLYRLAASAPGYAPAEAVLEVTAPEAFSLRLELSQQVLGIDVHGEVEGLGDGEHGILD